MHRFVCNHYFASSLVPEHTYEPLCIIAAVKNCTGKRVCGCHFLLASIPHGITHLTIKVRVLWQLVKYQMFHTSNFVSVNMINKM